MYCCTGITCNVNTCNAHSILADKNLKEKAKNAFRRQLNYFKGELETEIERHARIDSDTKVTIKLKAMALKRICVEDYRRETKDIEYEIKESFNADDDNEYNKVLNLCVAEYQWNLSEAIDIIINRIPLLTDDNKAKIICFNAFSLYKGFL